MRRFMIVGLSVLSLSAAAALDSDSSRALPVLSGDASAIAALRAEGQGGLDWLLALRARRPGLTSAANWSAAIDAVAGQKDATYSELFWHTDLDTARLEAITSGKPILSLRLLGDLTEEYSCANSRFFRAALYSNPELSALMREQYVLHWSSERAAPKMTIDLGDGRTLVRTITGNSAHYVLDSEGRPLDVIPGLYGPGAFQAQLEADLALFSEVAPLRDRSRTLTLQRWHAAQQASAEIELRGAFGLDDAELSAWLRPSAPDLLSAPPISVAAMGLTMGKGIVEMPVLEQIVPPSAPPSGRSPEGADWGAAGQRLYAEDVVLHSNSVALIAAEQPLEALGLGDDDSALAALTAGFERAMVADTARNELLLHTRVHGWFASGSVDSLADLNQRVYDELFETPADDPWMGLLLPDAYTGLSLGGAHGG